MTEQLTSPSNSVIDQNLLRLNSSSSCCLVSPSESNFGSHLKDNLIPFTEYKCQPCLPLQNNIRKQNFPSVPGLGLGKKKLTIQIDQNYDYENNYEVERFDKYEKNDKQEKNKIKPTPLIESQAYTSQESSRQIDCLELISPIQAKNVNKYDLQSRVKQLEQACQSSQAIISQREEHIREIEQELNNLQAELKQKNSQCQFKQSRIEYLEDKLKQKDHEIERRKQELKQFANQKYSSVEITQLEEKLREKDGKMRELAKINQKLKNLNKDLIRQVKISEKKVRDLEKEIQSNLCIATQQNIHRLKQSSLKLKEKQNYQRYNGTSHNQHTKTERDSLHTHTNLNTTKQKQSSFAIPSLNNAPGGRKSLQRKKNPNTNTTSAGQLSQPKKSSSKIGNSSSSNTILNKKLMHK